MYHVVYRGVDWLSRALALVGGVILIGLIILTCVSIAGRALMPLDIGFRPLRGIYDYTEIAMATAIFAFLPIAQFREAHARVDLFAASIHPRVNKLLDLLFNCGMLVAAYYGTWRLYLGMQDKLRFGETTAIVQIPVWQGYALALLGAACFVLVAAFCVLRSLRRLVGYSE